MSIDVYATKYMGGFTTYAGCREGASREMVFEYANCTESRRNGICDTKLRYRRVDVTL